LHRAVSWLFFHDRDPRSSRTTIPFPGRLNIMTRRGLREIVLHNTRSLTF